ncbi:hypothetical protein EKN06_05675 [Croceicoccus ponticola]|uniref:Phytanoyl-CoA dioxygenase n=1 Tax=Croceicoccus ponticola TaxID=2217664 RepID=A0A437H1Y1_9SPHN|nr:phytanoyl-CoA dioxygenase family protein [Croceicoccus ponticola]RVQ69648.1 hypothetical protein EKN06_05675 [Croceicoccus ponticola]
MMVVAGKGLPRMKHLNDATGKVGDPDAVFETISRFGHAYFRNVLDLGAVSRLKVRYLDVLKQLGVIDSAAEKPIWNGADLSDFPLKIEQLHEDKVWEQFVKEPAIEAFFTSLLGDRPFWFPIVEYRITPPVAELPEDPLIGRHQDGFYNIGMECYTCWVPLMEIDEQIGGLSVVPGLNHGEFYHDLNDHPRFRIPPGVLPEDDWARETYYPGDLVMFDKFTPHSGLPNTSDRFRMSMDLRVAPRSGTLPVLGEVLSFTEDAIEVRKDEGGVTKLAIDENTYCRWTSGARLPVSELRRLLRAGDRVLASAQNGRALILRPPR